MQYVDEHEQHDPQKTAINVPVHTLNQKPHTLEELEKDLRDRINRITQEFINGLSFIKKHKRSVTFFGSARLTPDNPHYEQARRLGNLVAGIGYDVITGGGPGIMEAANRGAQASAGAGMSLGMNIELPHEQVLNPYVDDYVNFYYFFSRKVALTFSAEAYLFFPGGFGTLDEFFEIVTLVQTKKIVSVPIVLVGGDFWRPIDGLIHHLLLEKFQTISSADTNLYHITDNEEEILEIIKNAPLREE
jgi:uncharacterized protein (TIGR00730 family)